MISLRYIRRREYVTNKEPLQDLSGRQESSRSASVLLKEVMRQMCEEGTAIFFSTHVLEVAEKLCNKVAIIKDGKLVLAGRTQAIIGNQSLESLFMELEEK